MSDFELKLSPESIFQLNKIYEYFGGRGNKLEKLYEESGEFRDRFLLNDLDIKLTPAIVTEICDIGSCFLQLYFNEPIIREGLNEVIMKANKKIGEGYYR